MTSQTPPYPRTNHVRISDAPCELLPPPGDPTTSRYDDLGVRGGGTGLVTVEQTSRDERLQASGDEAGTPPGDRAFRPDVQGLRAVAVVLVVLFHAHVAGITGGYVGVDVFFVISGFVITGVLLRERGSTGSTSILGFYGRRIRRILPAATLVIVVAVVASYVLVGPITGNQTAGDARWASVFLINVHFASTGTNYLASTLPPSVLQNFWSLAVEEQFYLVYPTLFLIVAGLSLRLPLRRRLALVLGVIMVVSFVLGVTQTSSNPTAAYFSAIPRVWELALGGLIALSSGQLRRIPPAVASILSWLGLGAIVVAACTFTTATPYPGTAVALPVIGTGLAIAGGVRKPAHGAERLLGLRPFQWVGLISYSLYLWHWPVLTIAADRRATGTLPGSETFLCVVLSVILAVATYKLLENPVRHNGFLRGRRWATLALGGCLIATSLAVATVGLQAHRAGALATPGLANLQMADPCPAPSQHDLTALLGSGPKQSNRIDARVMLVGDSTACTLLPGLEAVAGPAGVQIENAAVIGCGVVSGEVAPAHPDGTPRNVNARSRLCQAQAVAAEDRALRSGNPDVILWSSSWERFGLVVGSGRQQHIIEPGSAQWDSVLTQRMTARVKLLTAKGATVIMLTQAPFVHLNKVTGPTSDDENFLRLNTFLRSFAAHTPHVRVLDLSSYLCSSGPPCPLVVDSVWVRGDGAHYTTEGSLWAARWILPQVGVTALRHTDNALPVMRLAGVSNGQTVRGSRYIAGFAPFHVGITGVDITATSASGVETKVGSTVFWRNLWILHWNSSTLPNGTYTLRCTAYNAAGDHSTSKGVTVHVAN